MAKMELEIKNPKERAEVAGILVDNGYRVWTERVKKGGRSASTIVLCADKGEKGEEGNERV